MADVNGFGPYLGVYLQQQHWSPGPIGIATTVGGLAAMAVTAPFGALVDRTAWKRAVVVVSAIATVLSSLAILISPSFAVVIAAQTAVGIATAAIGPAIAGISLGLVRQEGYPKQLGRNEAFNHAGNITAAVAVGFLGYIYGLWVAFVVMAIMAVCSVISVSLIDSRDISYRAARGMGRKKRKASRFKVLLQSRPLALVAICVTLFHFGNAALLPLLGQSLAASGSNASASTSAAIVVAQCVMIPVALLASWIVKSRGYWFLMLIAVAVLPVRGVIAALVTHPFAIFPIQALDGVGAGIIGVAVPGVVARILRGTGHINAGLGTVLTLQAAGISLSPGLAGVVAERFGYSIAFLSLSGVALLALGFWIVGRIAISESTAEKLDGT